MPVAARPSLRPVSPRRVGALRGLAGALAIGLLASGCSEMPWYTPPPPVSYLRASFDALPGWQTADPTQSLEAFLQGCDRLKGNTALAPVCAAARAVPPDDAKAARSFFESTFVPYAIVAGDRGRDGLVTGYYEPILHGSRQRSDTYRYPVYGVPPDLLLVDLSRIYPELAGMRLRGRLEGRRVVPYFSRAEIDSQGKSFEAPVIAWVSDPVALYFLQIQGSGQIELDTGERLRVGYADQNGYPYSSLGRHLVDAGELPLDQASMQGIRAWAAKHPDKLQDALNRNASYVFFRELPGPDGPIGALGVPLTAGYSLAVDRRYVPLGAPVYLATSMPNSTQPLDRLMAAQDTGGAIRGAVRVDFYWGTGEQAGQYAGSMRQAGRLWLLWPRGSAPPG